MDAGPLLRETPTGPSLPPMGCQEPCLCSEDGYGDTGAGTHTQGTLEGS
jgi:hypothetical protein